MAVMSRAQLYRINPSIRHPLLCGPSYPPTSSPSSTETSNPAS
ncbi:unnamed protein product [Dibothriocephalus latus]|uniref:Uncharacterized protein n=1 Tax=Dibothriocephalus latus TaxID=60516 RepID=A0A3P7RKC9_DIBLA|nr:unnamed protein product [Dibothriocephalus latus]